MMKDLETSNGTIAAISQLHQTMAEMLSATENGVQPSAIKVNLKTFNSTLEETTNLEQVIYEWLILPSHNQRIKDSNRRVNGE